MTRPLVIVGCGGFGREVWAIVQALITSGEPWYVEGFADDSPADTSLERVRALNSVVIGTVADLTSRRTPYDAVIAVGSPPARRRICAALAGSPVTYPRLIHPDATIGPEVILADGVVVAPGARLSTAITVGSHVQIDQNVTVGHDSAIGDFARLNPQACVSGSVKINSDVLVGAGATVLQNVTLGSYSTVGAGACVVADVAPGAVVKGVPAR